MILISKVNGTIDVNLREFEYLAARLDPFECRRLVAALHYTTYDLPKNLAAAERMVDENISCLRQLLHWNSTPMEGRGDTHVAIIHRLRQLNHNDLADWLGKTAFRQLGKDMDDVISRSFEELGKEETETSTISTTAEISTWSPEQDPWLVIDTIFMAVMLGVLGTLLFLIGGIIVYIIQGKI
ncbi:hypothetical protein HN011_009755 [Eciton burchellii]|nr:hypothetical protein HN011_009755 [Eciton burchellii]